MDLSFKNALIKAYFEGSNDYIPSSELMYVHEHPLVQNSFVTELEGMINRAAEVMVKRNIKGIVVQRFIDATEKLGAELPGINKENAPTVLEHLRAIYKLCDNLLN